MGDDYRNLSGIQLKHECPICGHKTNMGNLARHMNRCNPAGSKHCPKCGLTKPDTYFHNNISRLDGLAGWCKDCLSPVIDAWRVDNPESRKSSYNKRRAIQASAEATLTNEEWLQILEDFNYVCFWCGASYENMEHLYPLCCGGTHTASNVVPSCKPCNGRKGTKDPLDFLISITEEEYRWL